MKRIHLIAIGGAIMHNLAIALARKGYEVTGSDDAIYDPAKGNLEEAGLLPAPGWDPDRITADIDIVILGMHARIDNPELLKAQEMGLSIMSFPEFVANEAKDKKRVVVAGSHGKTTTTAMLMHALAELNLDFDYLVGSSLDGFDLSVKLTDAPIIVIEGDEYLSSPIDRRSKFLWYEPHISIITGIAYDHINVFPTFGSYVQTFADFVRSHPSGSMVFWYANDEHLQSIMAEYGQPSEAYDAPDFKMVNGRSVIRYAGVEYPMNVVGRHNMENLRAAALAAGEMGVDIGEFYKAMQSFEGAGRRMEKIFETANQVVYRDFAHSPSKLKATTSAVKEAYPGKLTAVFELHTFSSLNKDFLPYYKSCMDAADHAVVFYNESVFEFRKMEVLSKDQVRDAFGGVQVVTDVHELETLVQNAFERGDQLLLMSSGKFDDADFSFIG